jgi:hypothetical protein
MIYNEIYKILSPTWLVHIPGHPWVLGQTTGTSDHKTHHGPDSGICHHHTPYSILYDAPWGYIQMAQIPGTPEMESRNCPEIVPKSSRVESQDFGSS